jgi:FlaA1/EpsC-like NDP-sugar epimerase
VIPTPAKQRSRFSAWRPLIEPLVDGSSWVLALVVSSLLRWSPHFGHLDHGKCFVTVATAAVVQVIFGFVAQYRMRWQVGSFEELASLIRTVSATTVVVIAVSLCMHHAVPTSAVIAGGALTLILSGGARCMWRLNGERRTHPGGSAKRVVVFGAGTSGRQVINALIADPDSEYLPVALLDDDPGKHNLRIRHLTVSGGASSLGQVARHAKAEAVIVALPNASSEIIRSLSNLAADADLSMRILPQVSGLFGPALSTKDLRPVSEADLLGRHHIDTEMDSIAGYLTGRRVLVTGAGGSIGSELCRQVHRFSPSRLIMLDHDESGLHHAQLSIEGRAMLDDRSLVVCDIRDAQAMAAVFDELHPEVVFHAAALKHLPLLEMWPQEAVKTNVIATLNVLEQSVIFGVDRFVNISTDKAAKPCSVLGYTKRLGERLTASIAENSSGTYLSVRFGNVLGSRGSVLTAFRTQVEGGGPITVTDPEITRYFMTIEEAVQLVVQAGAVGKNGEVLVLDMGSPVRIADVAKRLAREAPTPIDIVFTGLRPGEKMHEDLFGDGEVDRRPIHSLISQVPVPPLRLELIAALTLDGPISELKEQLRLSALSAARPPVSKARPPAVAAPRRELSFEVLVTPGKPVPVQLGQ